MSTEKYTPEVVTLSNMIQEAVDLDATPGTEYMRGMCELIARCFPTPDAFTDERAAEIATMIVERVKD